jgi:hypothetical protein
LGVSEFVICVIEFFIFLLFHHFYFLYFHAEFIEFEFVIITPVGINTRYTIHLYFPDFSFHLSLFESQSFYTHFEIAYLVAYLFAGIIEFDSLFELRIRFLAIGWVSGSTPTIHIEKEEDEKDTEYQHCPSIDI